MRKDRFHLSLPSFGFFNSPDSNHLKLAASVPDRYSTGTLDSILGKGVDRENLDFDGKVKNMENEVDDESYMLEAHCSKCKNMIELRISDIDVEIHKFSEDISSFFVGSSQKLGVDFPLCFECLKDLGNNLNEQMDLEKDEIHVYQQKIKEVEDCTFDEDAYSKLLVEIGDLERQEVQLKSHLRNINQRIGECKEKNKNILSSIQILERNQQRDLQKINRISTLSNSFENNKDSLQQKIAMLSRDLETLLSSNILNESFHIWFEGFYGTINNFRLGRLDANQVEWFEINGALGHCVSLLKALSDFKKYKFSTCILIPMGSFSKIQIKSGSILELYSAGYGFFWQSRFDRGITCYIECLQEFHEFLKESASLAHEFPFRIREGTIGGISVKYNPGHHWTRAMKYLLINLKHLILWCSMN